MFSAMNGGDSILFSRGGSFSQSGNATWVNAKSTASRPIVLSAYMPSWASGDEAKPLIRTSTGSPFWLADGGNSDHEEGYVIEKLSLMGHDSSGNWGVFLANDIDHVTMDSLIIDSFSIGVHVAGGNHPTTGTDSLSSHIILRNSLIRNNSGQGWLGGGDSCLVENCLFENNGFALAVFNHNIYMSHGKGVVIRNNRLHRSALISGQTAGVSLVIHGIMEDLLIEGNTIWEDIGACGQGTWGIAVDPGYATAEAFRNVTIRGNKVINVGNLGIGMAACSSCVIENNVIIHEQPYGISAIGVPDRQRGPEDSAMTSVIIRNNSIYVNNGASGGTGITLGTEGTGHVCVSNIVRFAGSAGFTSFNFNLAASNYRATGYNIVADPGFANPASPTYDLSLSSTSKAIGAGHPTLSTTVDFNGRARKQPPDAGAYESDFSASESGISGSPDKPSLKIVSAFMRRSVVEYSLPAATVVELDVFNIRGSKISTLVSGQETFGNHFVTWNAGAQTGIFFCRLRTAGTIIAKKLVLF